jgi:predicted MFS family arabinose efflux permease
MCNDRIQYSPGKWRLAVKSILKFIRKLADEHTELARVVKVLLIFVIFTVLAYFLGELSSKDPVQIGTALAFFGAAGSFNIYLVPQLTQKESTKWRTFYVLAILTVILIFLAVFEIIYLPMLSMIIIGGLTFANLTMRDAPE